MRNATQITGIRNVGELRSRLEAAARAAGRHVINDPRPLAARIEHDRLIADCPNCRAGIALHPDWNGAACMDVGAECFRWFPRVDYPADLATIDAVLKERPGLANRNWTPGESVALLEAENTAHLHAPPEILALIEGRKP